MELQSLEAGRSLLLTVSNQLIGQARALPDPSRIEVSNSEDVICQSSFKDQRCQMASEACTFRKAYYTETKPYFRKPGGVYALNLERWL